MNFNMQLGYITMDNATNNDTAMVELANLLQKKGISFDAKERRIHCYPHIINICVSHIVKSVAKLASEDTVDEEEEVDDEGESDEDEWETEEEDDVGYAGH